MINVLFLCHGNICRSPMAEFIFKSLINGNDKYFIQSKAVSSEEIGNPIYPPVQRVLRQRGIPFDDHRASRITKQDYDKFDYIIVMEEYNIPRLMGIIGSDPCNKVCRLLDFTAKSGDIEDPWFTGNYKKVFEQITEGCKGLLEHLESKEFQ